MSSFVGSGTRLNFDNMSQFPTADPVVWNIDEDAVLDELYGMLTAADSTPYSDTVNPTPAIQESVPDVNTYLPGINKLQHFDSYNPQFPLNTSHAVSMPLLPTQDQALKYNQILQRNPCAELSMQQVQQQQKQQQQQQQQQWQQQQQQQQQWQQQKQQQQRQQQQQQQWQQQQQQQQQEQQQQQQQQNLLSALPRYSQNNTMHNPDTPPTLNIPPVDKMPAYPPTVESTVVTFVDLKTFYEKGQCRLQGKSEQRLDYASSFVRIYLENPDNIKVQSAFVERSPDAAHILKDNVGQVPLKILPDESSNWIKVNLDDAGSEVYKLSKVKGEERNLFRIGLRLLLKDTNETKTFYSEPFQVKSKPKSTDGVGEDGEKPVIKTEPDLKKRAIKRSRNEDHEMTVPSPLSVGSSVFPEVITDHLEATTANIKQLKVNHPIQTQRGDIAYHFKLKDCAKKFELQEGDIIGFFENSYGKSEIRRLTCENVRHAKLAGVISRSAWLEGKTPSEEEKDPTDVVCVIGVVKVKVRGPVQNGERIYASLTSFPGVAMPEHVITQVTSEELTLVGQSLESVKAESPDSVNLVPCFVSILLSIQTQHTNKALGDMRTDVLEKVDSKISVVKKRLLRGLRWKAAILLIFLSLLGVLLYQLYAPLTAYRYWKCSLGSIDDSTSSFSFTTLNFQVPKVNGIEFYFADLMDKLDKNVMRKSNDSTTSAFRYYLNIDRCAAGGIKYGVRGPEFYVMDRECSAAYYHFAAGYHVYKTGRNFLCSFEQSSCTNCDTDEKPPDKSKEEACLSGIKEKKGSASFKFFSNLNKKFVYVKGIEATIDELRSKFNKTFEEVKDGKVARYFFNLKRCVIGKPIGPQFFAVNRECKNSYYYSSKQTWNQYNSASNVKCTPSF